MNQRETFILKLLRVREAQGWRVSFSLRNVKSDESHTFGSATDLAAFLESGGDSTAARHEHSDG